MRLQEFAQTFLEVEHLNFDFLMMKNLDHETRNQLEDNKQKDIEKVHGSSHLQDKDGSIQLMKYIMHT